jgi:ssDNA-binding Zn-finger/Zn-ribbon topoisomerase 1
LCETFGKCRKTEWEAKVVLEDEKIGGRRGGEKEEETEGGEGG